MAGLLRPHIQSGGLQGITVVTHGFQPTQDSGDSLQLLSQEIRNRADAENGTDAGAWLIDYDVRSEGGNGVFDFNFGLGDDGLSNGSLLMVQPSPGLSIRLGSRVKRTISGLG